MMKERGQKTKIKAVILAAGVGSRIRPLTDNLPKSLLNIGGRTILERMLSHISDTDSIGEVIFVLGYMQEKIRDYVRENFPGLNVRFVINDKYAASNTGFSLMLTENFIDGSSFIKFDADVVFDRAILERLINCEHGSYLCVDRNINLAAEEIKVILDDQNRVLKVNKKVNPAEAAGESIGIEKIDSETSRLLFAELRAAMKDQKNHHEYYEASYERLIKKNIPFHALDITGLNWTEIDTEDDLRTAEELFGQKPAI